MKRFMMVLASVALVGLFGASAWAGDDDNGKGKGKKADPEAQFKKLDANNDGKLSLDEFKKLPIFEKAKEGGKGKRPDAESMFKRLDTDKDGYLSLDEFKKMAEGRKKKDPTQ